MTREITALTAQKRNKNRVNVFLDGDFAFGLDYDLAARLRVGQTLSADEVNHLQQQDAVTKAKDIALHLISRRPRSIAEVSRHLQRKGYEAAAVERVVARLQELDLLDDEAFARYWVEQRETFKPRSRMVLRQELRQKGIHRAIIDAAITDVDETAAARQVAAKKARRLHNLDEYQFRNKLGGFLQRRGFPYEIINLIIDEEWQAMVEERTTDSPSHPGAIT